jgi:toluene monooxygenase system ferredoxin subunit
VTVGAIDVLVCNIDGEVFADEDRCPHLANPLSKGALDAHVLTCAAHEWTFDARTGNGVDPRPRASGASRSASTGTILVDLDRSYP